MFPHHLPFWNAQFGVVGAGVVGVVGALLDGRGRAVVVVGTMGVLVVETLAGGDVVVALDVVGLLVLITVVDTPVDSVTGLLVEGADDGVVDDEGLRERYQFAFGSPRHSPTVTPLQPFALMRSK